MLNLIKNKYWCFQGKKNSREKENFPFKLFNILCYIHTSSKRNLHCIFVHVSTASVVVIVVVVVGDVVPPYAMILLLWL